MPGGRGPGGPMRNAFLTEEEKAGSPKVTPALLKRIFSYLMPYKKQLVLVILCIIASSFMSLMPSILTGKISSTASIPTTTTAVRDCLPLHTPPFWPKI